MGLKEAGLRGSLRSVSTGVGAIPDSAIHRWKFGEGGGDTLSDSIGDEDATRFGPTWVSGAYVGDNALDGDGIDDYIEATTLGTFGRNVGTNHAWAFTVDDGGGLSDLQHYFGTIGDPQQYLVRFRDNGDIQWRIRDDSGDFLEVRSPSNRINDGGKHRIVLNKVGNTASDLNIWIDNTEVDTTIDGDQSPTNNSDFTENMVFFARNDVGTVDRYSDCVLDDILINSEEFSQSEISDDYNRQPWT